MIVIKQSSARRLAAVEMKVHVRAKKNGEIIDGSSAFGAPKLCDFVISILDC
jgi:hypothetical protein